jgi:hypothetical protein
VGPRRARTRLMSAIAGQACVSARHSQLGSICDRARPTSSNLCSCGHECSKNFSSIETRTRLDSHNDFCQARNVSSDLGNPSYDQAPCLSFHRLCSVASSSLLSNPSYCGLKRHSDAQFQWLSSCAPPDTASASSVSSGRPSACARPHLQRPPLRAYHTRLSQRQLPPQDLRFYKHWLPVHGQRYRSSDSSSTTICYTGHMLSIVHRQRDWRIWDMGVAKGGGHTQSSKVVELADLDQ